ncbi:MAG: hypothetical protein ACOY0T_12740 [Myxococcota bacterium]
MNRTYQRRKVTPKVRNGIVLKKHRHQATAAMGFVVDRMSPPRGCRHVVTKRDIHEFTAIIPDWSRLCEGLEGVLLTPRDARVDGWYRFYPRERTGRIEIPAWEGDLWVVFGPDYFDEHRTLFDRLAVATESKDDGVECRFTHAQAKAFLLLHVFLHELGHHVDRLESKQQNSSRRGEPFAEQYANELAAHLWDDYVRVFGDPTRSGNVDRPSFA